MPTPLGFKCRLVYKVRKGLNSFAWSSELIPGPMSCTTTDSKILKSVSMFVEIVMSTVLSMGLYMTALDKTFKRTCWYLYWLFANLTVLSC